MRHVEDTADAVPRARHREELPVGRKRCASHWTVAEMPTRERIRERLAILTHPPRRHGRRGRVTGDGREPRVHGRVPGD